MTLKFNDLIFEFCKWTSFWIKTKMSEVSNNDNTISCWNGTGIYSEINYNTSQMYNDISKIKIDVKQIIREMKQELTSNKSDLDSKTQSSDLEPT